MVQGGLSSAEGGGGGWARQGQLSLEAEFSVLRRIPGGGQAGHPGTKHSVHARLLTDRRAGVAGAGALGAGVQQATGRTWRATALATPPSLDLVACTLRLSPCPAQDPGWRVLLHPCLHSFQAAPLARLPQCVGAALSNGASFPTCSAPGGRLTWSSWLQGRRQEQQAGRRDNGGGAGGVEAASGTVRSRWRRTAGSSCPQHSARNLSPPRLRVPGLSAGRVVRLGRTSAEGDPGPRPPRDAARQGPARPLPSLSTLARLTDNSTGTQEGRRQPGCFA